MMIELLHAPYGQEHPYEQGPEERFPRDPQAEQPFVVGIVTRPPGAVQQVTLHTHLENGAATPIQALHVKNWQPELEMGVGAELLERIVKIDQDVWQAHLSAPPVGQTLTYWIEAEGHRSPEFSLRGEAWQHHPSTAEPTKPHALQPHLWETRLTPTQLPDLTEIAALPHLVSLEWLSDGTHARRVRLTFTCQPDEAFFGLGERFNQLNQRGQILDVRCYEQYKNQGKRTYMPIPFLLSSAGYGLYVESARWMQFDLATHTNVWTLEADLGEDENLRLLCFANTDPLEIIGQFTRFTGQPALPPVWAFGLWMSSNEWNSQARVLHEVQQAEAHSIDTSVVVIEAWSDETTFYIWNDAQYTPVPGNQFLTHHDFTFPPQGKWPDPKAMVDTLHDKGLRLLLWQVPAFKKIEESHAQHDADRAYFEQQGFGVREENDDLYRIRPFWFRDGYLLDVTHPAAIEWWGNKRAYLLDDLGIDGFKTDGGEHLWGAQTRFWDGRRGTELWNLYPRLYTQTYYDLATRHRDGDALVFSRAGFTGSQTSPAHWAGDENSTWEAFRHSILAGLSAGISGIIFWGWDLGGFSGEIPSAELYLRSTAMAAFCPIMQYHSEFNQHREPSRDRTPWNIQERTGDERVIEIFRFFVNVRRNLLPYIWQEAQWAAQSGQPMLRALALSYPQASPYQYFFGRDLLICPVIEASVTRWPVYLPPGTWIDFWTHTPVEGGRTIEVDAPLERIPIFVRQGAKIPAYLGSAGKLGEAVPLSETPNTMLDFEVES